MKEALLKKGYGIPTALLLVLLLSGTALVWYCFATISSTTEVEEPLSIAGELEFSDNMYPGKTDTWSFDIVNSADEDYAVKADLTTFDAPDGVSITSFTVVDDHGTPEDTNDDTQSDETDDLTGDGSAEFIISANTTKSCSLTISAARDAATGTVSVKLVLNRGRYAKR